MPIVALTATPTVAAATKATRNNVKKLSKDRHNIKKVRKQKAYGLCCGVYRTLLSDFNII